MAERVSGSDLVLGGTSFGVERSEIDENRRPRFLAIFASSLFGFSAKKRRKRNLNHGLGEEEKLGTKRRRVERTESHVVEFNVIWALKIDGLYLSVHNNQMGLKPKIRPKRL